MGKYLNQRTGDIHEIDDAHYEQIKRQGVYVPAPDKAPAKKKAAIRKKAAKK